MSRITERLELERSLQLEPEKKEQVLYVPTNKIKLSSNRVRLAINREDVKSMSENLKLFGIMQPIEVNENNEVILGNRRFEAAKLACLDTVPVIQRSSSGIHEVEKQLVSDLHSKQLSVVERALAFRRVMEVKGITKYALAKYLGLSHNLVCRTLAVLEANENTIKLMKQGRISQRKVAMILYRLKDKQLEDFVVNEVIEKGMNIVQAGNFIAEINDPEIFKKHFLQRVRSFKTSLLNFREKLKLLDLSEEQKREVIGELRSIDLERIFLENAE